MVKIPGRKPSPVALVPPITPRADRSLTAAQRPAVRPGWLSLGQRRIWDATAAELKALGLGPYAADQGVLEAYVGAVYTMTEANKLLVAEGVVTAGKDGHPVRNPAVIVFQSSARLVDSLAASLSLAPAARARLVQPPAAPSSFDTPEAYFAAN